MEQFIESLVAAGISGDRIERARRRGTAYECLWCIDKDGTKTINIKCRIEDHVMRKHMPVEEVPFRCTLCGFMCMRREQIFHHVDNYTRHKMAAMKLNVTDHMPYLLESLKPHIYGPSDYRAMSPQDSILHFLGVGEEEQSLVRVPSILSVGSALGGACATVVSAVASVCGSEGLPNTATASTQPAAKVMMPATQMLPSSTSWPPQVTSLPQAAPQWTLPVKPVTPLMQEQIPVPPLSRRAVQNPILLASPTSSNLGNVQPSPPLRLTQPEVGDSTLASQLTAILQNIAGIVRKPEEPVVRTEHLDPPFHSHRIVSPVCSTESVKEQSVVIEEHQGIFCDLDGTSVRVDNSGESKENVDVRKEVAEEEEADEDERSEVGDYPVYVPTAIIRKEPQPESESPIPREGDILDLDDENMSLSTPMKRSRDGNDTEDKKEAKKAKEDKASALPVDGPDLSLRTLNQLVQSAQKVAGRNMVLSERLLNATVDNTCVQGKLVDAVTRLRNSIDDLNREERRREERRRAFEQRWEEEWRREWSRRRDEDRRADERRREAERKDREDRRKRDEKEQEDVGKEIRPRSTVGRVYTKNSVSDATNRKH